MHPGSYAVSSPCAWLQTLVLTSPHLQELAGPWRGGRTGERSEICKAVDEDRQKGRVKEGRVKEKWQGEEGVKRMG